MVGWSDFLSAAPDAQIWHFVLGLAVGILVVVLVRLNPYIGVTVLAGFVAFVIIKEVWIASVFENETANMELVSLTFWYVGGAFGALVGVLGPKPISTLVAGAGITLVVILLLTGII